MRSWYCHEYFAHKSTISIRSTTHFWPWVYCLEAAGSWYGVVGLYPTRAHAPSVWGRSLLHYRDQNFAGCFSVFGEFIHDLSVFGYDFFACQTVTARNAMPQYTGPRKSEARPFAQKPICWLVNKPSIHHNTTESGKLGGGNGLANARTTLSRVQALLLTDDSLGLLDDLLGLGEDELDVAGVGHVGVDLDHTSQNKFPHPFGTCRLR